MPLSNRSSTGVPAKNVVREIFRGGQPRTAGEFLYLLEQKGYVIVSRACAVPARRGRDETLGPLLGKSHAANIVGGA